MKIVECPICDSKFDIEKVPDDTKVKCGKCKRIFGIIQAGELIPILEEVISAAAPSAPTPPPGQAPLSKGRISRISRYGRGSTRFREGAISARERLVPAKPKEKPDFLLVVGGLAGLVGIGTLVFVLMTISKPVEALLKLTKRPPAPMEETIEEGKSESTTSRPEGTKEEIKGAEGAKEEPKEEIREEKEEPGEEKKEEPKEEKEEELPEEKEEDSSLLPLPNYINNC